MGFSGQRSAGNGNVWIQTGFGILDGALGLGNNHHDKDYSLMAYRELIRRNEFKDT